MRAPGTRSERIALSIAMFPRAEVGAGILLLAITKGVGPTITSIAGISLGLNLVLTGFFIIVVRHIVFRKPHKATCDL